MELPESLYQLIGEFALTFPKLESQQTRAKQQLAHKIASIFPEYGRLLIENFKIPFFNDFKAFYSNAEDDLLINAKSIIREYNLEEYQDIIMENHAFTIEKILNIVKYVYLKTRDLNNSCRIYCALGYPCFHDRFGNESYLITLIQSWTSFAMSKGDSYDDAQHRLLYFFDLMDSEKYDQPIFHNDDQKGILKFFPFSMENVNDLIDFVLKYDKIKSDTKIAQVSEFSSSLADFYDLKYSCEFTAVCNYYVYLFNKANKKHPYSMFYVLANLKWLKYNQHLISSFFYELAENEFHALLTEFCIDKYSNAYYIPKYRTDIFNICGQDKVITDIIYKLYNQHTISNYELVNIWSYIVLKKGLTYFNSKMNETNVILKVSEKEYPDEGKLLLPWKYVRFVDGKAFIYHPNHEKGENSTLPYIFETENANKEYMNIPKSILWNLPFIMCESVNGSIVKIDNQFVQHVIDNIAFIHKAYYNRVKSVYSSATYTATDILNRYKSEQLDYLKKRQNKKYPITPIIELSKTSIIKEEPALLFTISEGNDSMTLVYENVSVSRATYIFIVESASYHKALKVISSYFSSERPYKRSELQFSRDMFNKTDGFLRVIRVLHDDKTNWKYAISFYSKNQK